MIAMNNKALWPSSTKELPAMTTVDEIRLQLHLQKRKTHVAERLAAAASAVSASLDASVALNNVSEQLAYLLCLEGAAVCLFNGVDDEVLLHTWSKRNSPQSEELHTLEALLKGSKAVSLIRERSEPAIIDDVRSSPLLSLALINQIGRLGIQSLALLPLITARGVIGFIVAPHYTSYQWDVDDIRAGLTFAGQSAVAIENAMFFNALQQHNWHIEVLNAVGQFLSTLPDPSKYLNHVLGHIADITDLSTSMIMIWLSDESSKNITLVAHYGQFEGIFSNLYQHLLEPLSEIAHSIVASGKPLLINDMEHDGHSIHKPLQVLNFRDLMAVPLTASSVILGVLLVINPSHHRLTNEDLSLFTTIGQQLGMTLKNAQLQHSANEMEIVRETNRLKDSFFASVSHDLRSPLTAIHASVESLLDQGNAQSARTQKHLLHNIAGQANRLELLVDQLLDLSRIDAGVLPLDRDWIELPALIADAVTKFQALNSQCRVELDISPDLPLCYVDSDRFVQVLWNLLENANKYAPPSTSVMIEARWTGTEVIISIMDLGPGIPSGEHEKIFQRFYRLEQRQKEISQGCGLGLAICRGIVEAHGGRIWVENRPDGGSVFRFTLPIPAKDLLDFDLLEEQSSVT